MADVSILQVLSSSAARLTLSRTAAAALDKWEGDCTVMRYVGARFYTEGT